MAEDDLDTIFDTWDKETGDGRDDERTRQLSDDYVEAHSKEFAGWDNLSLEALVRTLESAREKGDEAEERKIQVWLWHHFEPQNIGGTYEPQLRVANN